MPDNYQKTWTEQFEEDHPVLYTVGLLSVGWLFAPLGAIFAGLGAAQSSNKNIAPYRCTKDDRPNELGPFV